MSSYSPSVESSLGRSDRESKSKGGCIEDEVDNGVQGADGRGAVRD